MVATEGADVWGHIAGEKNKKDIASGAIFLGNKIGFVLLCLLAT